jgi:spermidine synthase
MTITERYNVSDGLRCRVPDMNEEGLVVSTFTVEPHSLENLRNARDGRGTQPGDYKMLTLDGRLWMSDTDAERRDHYEPVWQAQNYKGGRGLVFGLGLGCVVGAMLDHLDHVDVVEKDERVARLIGGWFKSEFGSRVTIHHADCFEIKWPTGTYWDVAWYDVWPDLTTDNLSEMAKIHRSYGRRTGWQGSWGKSLLQSEKRRQDRNPWSW